jgi:Family of unknown function (DUF5677)
MNNNLTQNAKDKYKDALHDLELLCQLARQLSHNQSQVDSSNVVDKRQRLAATIFKKLALHTTSIFRLFPGDDSFSLDDEIWDISSIMSLSRVLIDNYYIFRYLAVDAIEDSDSEFRILVAKRHGIEERIKILKEFSSQQPILNQLRADGAALKKQVEDHPRYQQLEKRQLDRIANGKGAILFNNKDMLAKADVDSVFYSSHYWFYSQHVHTYPFSVEAIEAFQMLDNDALNLFGVTAIICTVFLSFAIQDFLAFFSISDEKISKEARDVIDKQIAQFKKTPFNEGKQRLAEYHNQNAAEQKA